MCASAGNGASGIVTRGSAAAVSARPSRLLFAFYLYFLCVLEFKLVPDQNAGWVLLPNYIKLLPACPSLCPKNYPYACIDKSKIFDFVGDPVLA